MGYKGFMDESTRTVGFKPPSPTLTQPQSKAVFSTLMYVTNSAVHLTNDCKFRSANAFSRYANLRAHKAFPTSLCSMQKMIMS